MNDGCRRLPWPKVSMVTFSSNTIAVTTSGLRHLRILPAVAWVKTFIVIWPRTVVGSLKSSWALEANRIARRKKHPFRIGNDNINAWLMSVVLWTVMLLWLGIGILPYLIIQMLIAITLLEAVNYLEHYGMLRQKVKSGDRERSERVDPQSLAVAADDIATNVPALSPTIDTVTIIAISTARGRYQALRALSGKPSTPDG